MGSGTFPASPSPRLRDKLPTGPHGRGDGCTPPNPAETQPFHQLPEPQAPRADQGDKGSAAAPQGQAEPTCISTAPCLQENSPDQAPT